MPQHLTKSYVEICIDTVILTQTGTCVSALQLSSFASDSLLTKRVTASHLCFTQSEGLLDATDARLTAQRYPA